MSARLAVCCIDDVHKRRIVEQAVQADADVLYLKDMRRANAARLSRFHSAGFSNPGSILAACRASRMFVSAAILDFLAYVEQDVKPAREPCRLQLVDGWTLRIQALSAMTGGMDAIVQAVCREVPHADGVLYLDLPPDKVAARNAWLRERNAQFDPSVLDALHAAYERVLTRLDVPVFRIADAPAGNIAASCTAILRDFA